MSRAILRSRKKKIIALAQGGQFTEANNMCQALCRRDPKDAEIWLLSGAINGQLGEYNTAIECCHKAIKLQPDYLEAWYNLAQSYMHCNRTHEAIAAYKKTIELKNDYVEAHYNLGYALELTGNYEAAMNCYRKAISIKPDYAEAYCNLGNLMNNLGQGSNGEALRYLQLALKINPAYMQGQLYLGKALHQNGQIEEALETFDRILEKEPDNIEAISAKAMAWEKQGNYDQARLLLEPLLDCVDPNIANAFAAVATHHNKTNEAIVVLEKALQQTSLTKSDARTLHFRLGKLLDKAGDYDSAFDHFQSGNSLQLTDYNITSDLSHFDDIAAFFSKQRMTDLPRSEQQSQIPVFIVGMPRSGTTLVEQILDSHPDVFGAGELVLVEETASTIGARIAPASKYPTNLEKVTEKILDEFSNRHTTRLKEFSQTALRIVDKMPHNFRYLALIELLFPNAHIIHCTRHPLDTCLSIYTYDFNAIHGYSRNLNWLGQYYRKYKELMDYWEQILHIPVMQIKYEDLVLNQEQTTRQLIDFCGLSWNQSCLNFFNNKRSVNTISYDQVRRPIYKQSLERWRNYESHLAPLKNALDFNS